MSIDSSAWLGAVASGFVTGVLVAAPIGPVNLEIIRRTLRFGWQRGAALGAGAVLIDLSYFTAFSLGMGALLKLAGVALVLDVLGGGLLGWLGWMALRDARRLYRNRENPTAMQSLDGSPTAIPSVPACFGTGLVMTGANPMTIAFWSALSLGFAAMTPTMQLAASTGVVTGCSTWVATLVVVLTLARRRIGARLFAAMTAAGGLMLLWFALKALLRVGRLIAGA
ncbi:hypothetical protein GC173_06170 [bacterium]|nr:hypothetical protein [bacterium]